MGSGTKNRKENDAPIIRRPKMINSAGGGGGVDIGGAASTVCIPSFDHAVTKSALTQKGIKVNLKRYGETYSIVISGSVVGELNQKYSTMITTCGAMGVKYSGEIVEKNNRPYARFDRISK